MKALVFASFLLLLHAASTKTEPTIRKVDGFAVVGIKVRTKDADEMGPNGKIPAQWQRFYKEGWPNRLPHQLDDNVLALYSNYAGDTNGEYDYTIGMRVNSTASVPAG